MATFAGIPELVRYFGWSQVAILSGQSGRFGLSLYASQSTHLLLTAADGITVNYYVELNVTCDDACVHGVLTVVKERARVVVAVSESACDGVRAPNGRRL